MKGMTHFSGLGVLAGIWLIVAPFVLNYTNRTATTNDVILGALIILISLCSYSRRRWHGGEGCHGCGDKEHCEGKGGCNGCGHSHEGDSHEGHMHEGHHHE